jgi:parallel beta-helix repeat protein
MQLTGLTTDVPTSALFSEIFLQQLEHIRIINIPKNTIQYDTYFRYADGIFIVSDSQNTFINNTLHDCDILNSKLRFTIEPENNGARGSVVG